MPKATENEPYIHAYVQTYIYTWAQEFTTALAFTASEANLVDFMYMPQVETAKGNTWIGGDGVSAYKLDDCDTTAAPFMRDGPIQVCVSTEFPCLFISLL